MVAFDIEEFDIIDQILNAKKASQELEKYRVMAKEDHPDWCLKNRVLFYKGRLEKPLQPPELRTKLIRHIHSQLSVAYAGVGKMKILIGHKYHWKSLGNDINTFVANCECVRMKLKHDNTPGYLNPLEIPKRQFQNITMDFTE